MPDVKSPQQPVRVLDVGQCGPDHSAIRSLLTRHYRVQVDRADSVDEALEAMEARAYALVLVNRLMDLDGSEGKALIERAKSDDRLKQVPIMLVSNYADAQQMAESIGAEPGFGKSELRHPQTLERLGRFLPAV